MKKEIRKQELEVVRDQDLENVNGGKLNIQAADGTVGLTQSQAAISISTNVASTTTPGTQMR